jgi:hypothetical protein
VPSSWSSSVPAELQADLGLWLIKFCVVRGFVFTARRAVQYRSVWLCCRVRSVRTPCTSNNVVSIRSFLRNNDRRRKRMSSKAANSAIWSQQRTVPSGVTGCHNRSTGSDVINSTASFCSLDGCQATRQL